MQLTNMEILVMVTGIGLIGLIYYYFFGAKSEGGKAMTEDGKQKMTVVVDAAYVPTEIEVKVGVPVEITFDRRDRGDCTEWVIFEKLPTAEGREIKAQLPEGRKTAVAFTPTKEGKYGFVCGMGMVHGKLIVSK